MDENIIDHVHDLNDENIVDIVNQAFEDFGHVDFEEGDFEVILDFSSEEEEDQPLSGDNDYASDSDENDVDILDKVVSRREILTLNLLTKFCAIYFYYAIYSGY